MFYLHTSNRTEELLEQLAAVIQYNPQNTPFDSEFFLIQSQGMERFLSQSLARKFSCFCNYRFFLPMEFLLYTAEKIGVGTTPDGFDRDTLSWRIDALLAEKETAINPVYTPLHRFLSGGDTCRRRFQLARRLANLFDQYQLMRSDIIERWQQGGQHFTGAAAEADEKWQQALWQRLLAQEGGASHRAALFQDIFDTLQKKSRLSALPKRLSIFGVYTLPPIFLTLLGELAEYIDVHLYLLSPCRGYWADMKGEKAVARQSLKEKRDMIDGEGGHPLLSGLGLLGRELQDFLLDNETIKFTQEFPSWQSPADGQDGTPTLLHTLQADMLEGEVCQESFSNDNSIRIIAAHSRWRELEILREHLSKLLGIPPENSADSANSGKFGLDDIVVMAPNIEEYAPLIPAVFAGFRHSIADCNLHWRNPAAAVFARFLELFTGGGRFGRSEVMELLQQPLTARAFALSPAEAAELALHLEAAGVRWGLSAADRKRLGQGFTEASFAAGIERLLMGAMIDCEEFVGSRDADDGILPYRFIEGKGTAPIGSLCEFIAFLEEARKEFSRNHTIQEWSSLLLGYADRLLKGESREDDAHLAELFSMLASLGESARFTPSHSSEFSAVYEWFSSRSREVSSSSGFLRGRLTFCSMLPMRSIPFKVVCLLGLDDGIFPKNDRADTFDLMAADRRPLDRSPRNDDRYQFLEALLSARNILYLSYIGLSEKTGEKLPPSVVVSELLDLLQKSYGIGEEEIAAYHPLYPFSKKYFLAEEEEGEAGKFFSYNQRDFAAAEAQKRAAEAADKDISASNPFNWWQGEVKQDEEQGKQSLAITELFAFIKNPQRYFVKRVLGISLDEGEAAREDRECFAVDTLQKYHANREIFAEMEAGRPPHSILQKRLQKESGWPLGEPGTLQFAEQERYIEPFLLQAKECGLGLPRREERIKIECEAAESGRSFILHGALDNLYDNGALFLRFGKLRGRDLLVAWLHHQLAEAAGICPQNGRKWQTFLLSMGKDEMIVTNCLCRETNGEEGRVDIADILHLYQEGCRRPLYTLIEPAYAYAKIISSPKAKKRPQVAAQEAAQEELKKDYDTAELLLLLGEGSREKSLETILNTEEFIYFAENIVAPIYQEFCL